MGWTEPEMSRLESKTARDSVKLKQQIVVHLTFHVGV